MIFKSLTLVFVVVPTILFSQLVEITVLDSLDNRPVVDCNVHMLETDQSFTTNKEGKIQFVPLATDKVTIKLTALGYRVLHKEVSLRIPFITLKLQANHLDMHEVTVSSGSTVLKQKNPFHVESRKLSDLNAISTLNLGELMGKIPGVYAASLGNGISKPVIRGMQGMRIVTLLNGLRLEGQQWGGDHGIGLSSLGISSVEVIKGPATLLYGADALGGVVYLVDAPFAASYTRSVEAGVDAFANSMGGRSQVMFRESYQRFRWLVALNYSNHADFQLPSGKFAKNSRFNDLGAKLSMSYSGNRSLFALRYTMSHSTAGIPGHTHDSTATPMTFQVEERGRFYELPAQFFQNHLLQTTAHWYRDKSDVNIMVGGTANRLIEYDEKVTIPSLSMLLMNGIAQAKWTYKWNPKVRWISGFQSMLQNNTNALNASDTLIPNARVLDAGVFTSITSDLGKWNIQGGLRYDFRGLVVDASSQRRLNYHGLNGTFGAVWASGKTVVRGNASTGFRAPHLTELYSNGYHHGALRYEVGREDLKPEKASQLDLTLERHSEHSVIVVNPFVNYIRDYIYLQPMDTLMDGIPAFSYVQNNQVLFYGLDVGFHFHPHFAHGLHWEVSASYIAANALGDSSVSLIPQPRLMNTLRYELNLGKKIRLKDFVVQSTLMGPQNQVAFNESASNAYHVLDAAFSLILGKKEEFTVKMGVRNLLNTTYIDHLSRLKNIQMPFPGRNIYFSLAYALTRKF
jgi:iron complex outermembrane receptor protein